jgi:hypothetical protein
VFFEIAVEESCFDIEVKCDEAFLCCKENTNGGGFDNRCISFVVVFAGNLSKSTSGKACFCAGRNDVFEFEYPFGADGFTVGRMRNKLPGLVMCE